MTDLQTAALQALEALKYHQEQTRPIQKSIDAIKAVEEALRLHNDGDKTSPPLAEQMQEPVAWYFEARHIDSAWAAAVTLKHPGPEGKYMRKVTPLYTAPPQRKPLTTETIYGLFVRSGLEAYHQKDFVVQTEYDRRVEAFARAIERAHNIGNDK